MWWFSENSKRLGYGDNRKIKIGRTHKVEGELILCKHGLHASKRIIDALKYARGSIIWKVRLGGVIVHATDKSVASERTYISGGIDVSDVLGKFIRMCALDVIHLWKAPSEVVEYLKTGKEALRDAAWDAAWTAAWTAAAGATARTAAAVAAWVAAGDAAAGAKQNKRLTRMINRAIRG